MKERKQIFYIARLSNSVYGFTLNESVETVYGAERSRYMPVCQTWCITFLYKRIASSSERSFIHCGHPFLKNSSNKAMTRSKYIYIIINVARELCIKLWQRLSFRKKTTPYQTVFRCSTFDTDAKLTTKALEPYNYPVHNRTGHFLSNVLQIHCRRSFTSDQIAGLAFLWRSYRH